MSMAERMLEDELKSPKTIRRTPVTVEFKDTPLTHEELANMLRSSRETVTRMLARFRKEKLIEMRGSSIVILAPELMDNLAA